MTYEMVQSMGSAAETFADKLNRKLKAKEKREDKDQKRTAERHSLMLKGMTTIRKALQETCKITLGERFSFEIEIDDFGGWPRVQLQLIDHENVGHIEHSLIVSAQDAHQAGTIEFKLRNDDLLGQVHMSRPAEFNKIPHVLKQAVRSFLDIVAEYVLNPVQPEATLDEVMEDLEVEEKDMATVQQLAREDMFSEDIVRNDNLVLPDEDAEDLSDFSRGVMDAPDVLPRDNRVEEPEEAPEPLDLDSVVAPETSG